MASVVDTAEKFIGGVVDTGEQFFGGVVDIGDKFQAFWLFMTDINDTGEKVYQRCHCHRRSLFTGVVDTAEPVYRWCR